MELSPLAIILRWLHDHASSIPFMMLSAGDELPKVVGVRIVEALIIAILTAAFSGYVTLQVMQSKQQDITSQITELKAQQKSQMIDIQTSVRDTQQKVYDLMATVARLQGEVEKQK